MLGGGGHDLVLATGEKIGQLEPVESPRMGVGVVDRNVEGW
jgi:hypothetical protein